MGLALNTACFSYVPMATSVPPKGTNVRVELNADGTTDLARFLGPRVGSVDGTVSSVRDDDALVIGVSLVRTVNGQRQPWSGEDFVTFPKAYVASLQQRVLNRRKSYIAGITIATTVLLVTAIVVKGGGGQGLFDTITDGGINVR